jgi:thymidylate kinase
MKFLEKNYNFNNPNDTKFILIEGMNGSGKTTQAKKLVAQLEASGIKAIFNHEPTARNWGALIRQIIDGAILDEKLLDSLNTKLDILWAYTKESIENDGRFTKEELKLIHLRKDKLKKILNHLINKEPINEEERQTIYVIDRYLDITDNILLNLGLDKKWVVEDRYDISTYVYGKSHGLDFPVVQKLHKIFLNNMYLSPDLILYYWLPIGLALERNLKSGKIIDIYENKKDMFLVEQAAKEIFDFKNINPKPGQSLRREFCVNGKRHYCFIINTEPSLDEVFQETWRLVKETFSI